MADFDSHADDESRLAAVEAICKDFNDRKLPATGFVNMVNHERQPALMEAWRDCGLELGNHTWSHKNADAVELEVYLEDLRKGDGELKAFLETQDPLYFRYPYLRRGKNRARHDAIEAQLVSRLPTRQRPHHTRG